MVEIKEAIEAAGALEVVGIPLSLTLFIETSGGAMNQGTQKKITEAIEKLGETASYRNIATEAKVSADTVRRYKQEVVQQPEIVQQNRTVVTELPQEVWDGRRRPLLAMIGYLPSATLPLSEGRPLARVPNYSMLRA